MTKPKISGPKDKPVTPDTLKPFIAKAKARTQTRPPSPPLGLKRNRKNELELEWPFADQARDWHYLVLDAFGTRHSTVAMVFINQLEQICTPLLSADNQWNPDQAELAAVVAIVSACRPKDEAQAAMAAQMAVAHMLSMRVAGRISQYPWDTKMIAAYAKLTATYAAQMEIMAGLNGKRRSTRQTIVVQHEKHVHQHQHVHLEGGVKENGGQPYAAIGDAVRTGECLALPGKDAVGQVVPLPSREGQAGLQDARGKGRSAKG